MYMYSTMDERFFGCEWLFDRFMPMTVTYRKRKCNASRWWRVSWDWTAWSWYLLRSIDMIILYSIYTEQDVEEKAEKPARKRKATAKRASAPWNMFTRNQFNEFYKKFDPESPPMNFDKFEWKQACQVFLKTYFSFWFHVIIRKKKKSNLTGQSSKINLEDVCYNLRRKSGTHVVNDDLNRKRRLLMPRLRKSWRKEKSTVKSSLRSSKGFRPEILNTHFS